MIDIEFFRYKNEKSKKLNKDINEITLFIVYRINIKNIFSNLDSNYSQTNAFSKDKSLEELNSIIDF